MNISDRRAGFLNALRWTRARKGAVAAAIFLIGAAITAYGAAFTPGNVVVERIGGGGALSSTATNIYLDEFSPAGALVQTIVLPGTSGSGNTPFPISDSGTASSDGYMTRSVNGQVLVVPGYTNGVGVSTPASASQSKTVAIVKYDGSIDTRTTASGVLVNQNIRSAASTDGTNIWVCGANTIAYVTNSQNTAATSLSSQNSRCLAIAGNQLFVSSSSGTLRLGYAGNGLPTSGTIGITNLPGMYTTGGGPEQFAFLDLNAGVAGVDTLYVADTFGIVKWSLISGSWVSNGTINAGAATVYSGLCASNDAAGIVTIYAILGAPGTATGGGSLQRLIDVNGYNNGVAGVTTTTVANAGSSPTLGTGTVYRGVAFAPVAATPANASIIGLSGNLAFGNVATGTVATSTLIITNSGNLDLTVTNIAYPSAFSGAWAGIVSAGSASNVTVSFSPTAMQSYGGTIAVQSDAGSGSGTISCSGTGVAAVIGVSGNISFGNVTTGTVASSILTITNSGNLALTVTNIDYPAGFSGAWTGAVAAGNATNVTVTFAPLIVQGYTGIITVFSDATVGNGAISCSGTGTAVALPLLAIGPSSLDFGTLASGQTSNLFFTVSNAAGATLSGTASVSPPFAIASGSPFALAGGQTGVVTVSFSPASAGDFTNQVVFTSNGGDSSNVVRGTAHGQPSFTNVASGTILAQIPLSGGVNPGGLPTTAWYEYGLTAAYGSQTPQVVLPAGYATTNISLVATGLTAGLTYHYRIDSSNALGIVNGPDQTFVASGVAPGDLDGDGIVSQSELDTVLSNYWPNTTVYLTNLVFNGAGRFSVQLPNPGAWAFTVQSTTDFVTWSNMTTASPAYNFTDPGFAGQTGRTYRLQWP